jgi:hypothetical protein
MKLTCVKGGMDHIRSYRHGAPRQFCARGGQTMFEFYRSPDGHFGLGGRGETGWARALLDVRGTLSAAQTG